MAFREGPKSGTMRDKRVMQASGELGVAIEDRLYPESPKDPERRLFGKRGEQTTTPSRTTSRGTAPAAWQASTSSQAPERAASWPSAARSVR